MTKKNKVVSFHDDPDTDAKKNYREAIKRAKAANADRPGPMKNTPRFDNTASWSEDPPAQGSFLSEETKKGLEAMARAAHMESALH